MKREWKRTGRLAGSLLVCCLALMCAPAGEPDWEQLSQAARKAHAEGRVDEAIDLGLEALESVELLAGEEERLLVSLEDLALFHDSRGEPSRAVLYRRRAVDLRETLSDAPGLDLAENYSELGEQYQELGDLSEAAACLRRALEIREGALGPDDMSVARVASDLGLLLMAGEPDQARRLIERAVDIMERGLPPAHPDLAVAATNYGQLLLQHDDPESAEVWFRRALQIYELNAPNSARLAVGMDNLAEALRLRGAFDEAEELLKGSVEILDQRLGAEHPQLATSLNNLALLYRQQSRYDEAEATYRRAVTLLERTVGPEHPDLAAAIFNLARLHDAREQPGAAEPLFLRSLDMYERTLGPDDARTALVLQGYARMLARSGRDEEAARLADRAERILSGR